MIMKRIHIAAVMALFLISFGARGQEDGRDTLESAEPASELRDQPVTSDGDVPADTLSTEETDTTSTRTFGTAPGTGTTGAGSGNGDAAGNTGTPGSATMRDENKKAGNDDR